MAFRKDIEKGNQEIVRIEITEFRNEHFLNIRTWYTDKQSQEYKPTQRGVTLRLDHFAEIKAAILEAETEVQALLTKK